MGEYSSSGVGTAGLTTGIIGTALGALNSGLLGGDGVGGLFGGGSRMATLMAENSQLKAEKYSDNSGIELYKQIKAEMNEQRANILGEWIKPLAQESAANRERLVALEKTVEGNKALADKDLALMRKDIEIATLRMDAKIDNVACMARSGIAANAGAIAELERIVKGITCTKVCKDQICPEVMPRWNAWEAPTNAAPATQPVTGTINAV